MKAKKIGYGKYTTAIVLAAACLNARASDWVGGVGDWSDLANWQGGVPNNAGGWAIGNVQNGGTAIVSTAVPNVSEAWAGNYGGPGTIIVTNGGTLNVDNWLVVARMCCPSPTVTPLSTLIVDGGTINKSGANNDDGFIVGDYGGGLGGVGQLFLQGNGVINHNIGHVNIGAGSNGDGTGWAFFQGNSVFNMNAG